MVLRHHTAGARPPVCFRRAGVKRSAKRHEASAAAGSLPRGKHTPLVSALSTRSSDAGEGSAVVDAGGRLPEMLADLFRRCAEAVAAASTLGRSGTRSRLANRPSIPLASIRRMTHIGRITSGYLPRLKRSRRTSSAMPQMKETILLWVAWSMLRHCSMQA